MYHGRAAKKSPNPKQSANFFSLITFFFTFDLFRRGHKKDIAENDIYEVLPSFKASTVGDELEKKWTEEKKKNTKPTIYRLLWSCYGKYYLFLGFVALVMKVIILMVLPATQGKLMSYFSPKSQLTKNEAIFYGCVMIGVNVVICTYGHNYMFLVTQLGLQIKTAFCSLIYRKALKLSPNALSENGIGKIVTIISKDVASFETAIIFLNSMWIALVVFVVAGCLMYAKIGVAALSGMLLLLLVIPLQVYLGKLTSSFRIETDAATDIRLQLSKEALSSIKLIKMNTWENHFTEKIVAARKLEIKRLRRIYFAKATFLEVGSFVITLIWYILVVTYTQLGNTLTAEIVYFLRECLRELRSPVTISIPLGILNSAELAASVKRIDALLTSEEETKRVEKESVPLIELQDATIAVNTLLISSINMKITEGLNFFTGPIGSGKTSLLKAVLQSSVSSGHIKVSGGISYASEEPWLFPSSIKQNVVFGQELDERRYQEVMRVCALDVDCRSFKDGDNTIIDDGGRNLSRGQQARINLARAVYSDSDIYLMDDCLAFLDIHVQEYVFTECFKNFLKNKIVVLVSYNKRLLDKGDRVFLIENGTVRSLQREEIIDNEINFKDSNSEQKDDDVDVVEEKVQEDTTLLEQRANRNIYHEESKQGKVDLSVYKKYFQFGGGVLILIGIVALYGVAQTGLSSSDKAISKWVTIQQTIFEQNSTNSANSQLSEESKNALNLYTLAIIASVVFLVVRTYIHFNYFAKASLNLHNSMVTAVINATMNFFDVRYFGNILNRFAKDMYVVDELLPFNVHECLKFLCKLVSVITLILIVNIYFVIPAIVFAVILVFVGWIYMPTGRSLHRLDSATRSPVVGHINATLEGLSTIRAFGTQEILKKEFDRHQDLHTSAAYMRLSTSRAFAYTLDMLSLCFIAVVITRFLVVDKDTQVGNVGLAITQALSLRGIFQWGIRQWSELETIMTSVERILEFSAAKTEKKTGQQLQCSQLSGNITFKNVFLTYRNSKGHTLRNINFTIHSHEKIGIVGRTGAGKSSLISLLFRLYDYEGTVTVNGVDIQTIPLNFLRSNIAVISQDTTLFKGSLRSNLDPLGCYTDDQIWNVINKTDLKSVIPSLDKQVSEHGSNFSSGQKQLICLLRALVTNTRIIVLDEATANIDFETEFIIHEIIKQQLSECTIISIAHKPESVLNLDKVMVIDKGEIVEFDKPNLLMKKEDGVFFKMVERANLLTTNVMAS